MAKQAPTDVLMQAKSVLDAWGQINAQMAFGDLTKDTLNTAITEADAVEAQITTLENQLTDLRNQRQACNTSVWEMIKRVRAGVKGNYGDNSSQYEMVGGTRLSEKKPSTRKPAAP